MNLDVLPLAENFKDVLNVFSFLGFVLTGALNAAFMILISYKFFQTMQQVGYRGDEYAVYLLRKRNGAITRVFMLSLLSTLAFFLVNTALSVVDNPLVNYCGFIPYLIFLAIYFGGEKRAKKKVPLVYTRRMLRLIVSFSVLTVLFSVIAMIGTNALSTLLPQGSILKNYRYFILCFSPALVPYTVLLAYYINKPLEKRINKKFVKKAESALEDRKDLIKIGITGSYGKTSVKEILKAFLSMKYEVLSTPESYNTPLGISKSVNNLDDNDKIFIAEMGARRQGDIKELTKMVKPDIAVITGVTAQHLETFKTLKAIESAKYELIENMPAGGKAYFSSDNDITAKMYEKCPYSKVLAGAGDKTRGSVYAENVEISLSGSKFTLVLNGEKVDIETRLLGAHNVSNVALAAAVAADLGVSLKDIALAAASLKPVRHRLERIDGKNGVIVIDDGYNSNPEGFKRAIELLSSHGGKKYVVTPGFVELGFSENEYNFKAGEFMAGVADKAILVGRGGALHVKEGLLYKGYAPENILMVADLDEAKLKLTELLRPGDAVLFENDLMDKYL